MKFKHPFVLIVMLISILAILLISLSLAQTSNNPNLDDTANACFDGGSLEGTCNTTDVDRDGDIDQDDQAWLWRCGWYLVRVEYGIFSNDILNGICTESVQSMIANSQGNGVGSSGGIVDTPIPTDGPSPTPTVPTSTPM